MIALTVQMLLLIKTAAVKNCFSALSSKRMEMNR